MDLIALAGSLLLALCAIPAAIEAYRDKKCYYSWPFLWMWTVGEILSCIYLVSIQDWILLINYTANIACCLVLLYYNKRRAG